MSSVGLDIGGTFLKAAWLDEGPLTATRRPIPGFLDTSGKAREIDPDELMVAVNELLDEVVGERQCSHIFVTGQMAGLALIDHQGAPVAPLISWQDTRCDDLDSVTNALTADELASLGDGLRVGLPLVTLSGLDIGSEWLVTSMLGFVAGALTNTRAHLVHATDAASLGLLDVAVNEWSAAALRVARLEPERLPIPVKNVQTVGVSERYGAEVMTAVGDAQAALLGSGLSESQLSMNIATGCQVSVLSRRTASPAQLRPYFDGCYLHTVTHLPAGRLLRDAVRTDLGHEPNDDEWLEALQLTPDHDSVTGRALVTIAEGCVDAAHRLGAGSTIVFSGGLAQQIPALRERIAGLLGMSYSVFPGDDAALAGLRQLDLGQRNSPERT